MSKQTHTRERRAGGDETLFTFAEPEAGRSLPHSAQPIAAMQRIRRISAILDMSGERSAREHGLNPGDVAALLIVDRSRGQADIRGVDLQRALMNTSGAITKRLDRLEAAGLVTRRPDPADGRASLIEVTESGVDIAAKLRAAHGRPLQRRLRSFLTDEEWTALNGMLDQVYEFVKQL
jgi:DNA-binding MarR family transcriptional regulator